ncbi:MAG TPA: YkgJ family cysteine cluster protein [Thermoanaerobaculia bacterium]|nr:YkgJ family cysteine cluster protein [Thermoanaerobaculia bacterium]
MDGPRLCDLDEELLREVEGAFRLAAQRAGEHLPCAPGCHDCCHGPFPVNQLDARRLLAGLAELEAREPCRAAGIRQRAAQAVACLSQDFPGNPCEGQLASDDAAVDDFCDRHRELPCPVLDPATGHCQLYEHRPLACRTMGPPVRVGREDLPPCHLCFRGACPQLVEACRIEVDPDGKEDVLLEELEWQGAPTTETLIAFVLARPCGGQKP